MTDTNPNASARDQRALDFEAYLVSFAAHMRRAVDLPLYGIDNRLEDVVSSTITTLANKAHSMRRSTLPGGPDGWTAGQVNQWAGELRTLIAVVKVYMVGDSELGRELRMAEQNVDALQSIAGLAVLHISARAVEADHLTIERDDAEAALPRDLAELDLIDRVMDTGRTHHEYSMAGNWVVRCMRYLDERQRLELLRASKGKVRR